MNAFNPTVPTFFRSFMFAMPSVIVRKMIGPITMRTSAMKVSPSSRKAYKLHREPVVDLDREEIRHRVVHGGIRVTKSSDAAPECVGETAERDEVSIGDVRAAVLLPHDVERRSGAVLPAQHEIAAPAAHVEVLEGERELRGAATGRGD